LELCLFIIYFPHNFFLIELYKIIDPGPRGLNADEFTLDNTSLSEF